MNPSRAGCCKCNRSLMRFELFFWICCRVLLCTAYHSTYFFPIVANVFSDRRQRLTRTRMSRKRSCRKGEPARGTTDRRRRMLAACDDASSNMIVSLVDSRAMTVADDPLSISFQAFLPRDTRRTPSKPRASARYLNRTALYLVNEEGDVDPSSTARTASCSPARASRQALLPRSMTKRAR